MAIDLSNLKKEACLLAEKYKLKLVILFGSQATGKTHKHSDLDIAILSDFEITPEEEWKLSSEFAQISKIRDVEIINLKTVSPILLKNITDSGITLYQEKSYLFSLQRMRAFKMFIESKPLRLIRDQQLFNFLASHPAKTL